MKKILLAITVAGLLAVAAVIGNAMEPARKLVATEQLIENFYVDDVDTAAIVEEAIKSMLKELDPHSVYTDAEETKQMLEPLEGNFSGIGIQFQMIEDTLCVMQTIAGGPSELVGILPGDRILSAGDSVISGVKRQNPSVMKILRGPKGTRVDLKVLRGDEIIDFVVSRDDIPIYSVDAAYMVNPEIGYIRLTRFAEESPDEVRKAIFDLKSKGMTSLILDLEDNSGGYLGSACTIAQMFLPHGDTIVSTRGKHAAPVTYTVRTNRPIFTGPLAVMVNQYSASASEILAGAIQDNDRGVIVGRRTYGKGLVQRPFPFPDGSMVKLTTSRYYTPAGRCIQKPYVKGDDDNYRHDMINRYDHGELFHIDSIHIDEKERYRTLRSGRTVYGGGGIMPDRFVGIDTTAFTKYYRDLQAKNVFNKFVLAYLDENRHRLLEEYPGAELFISEFEVTPDMIERMAAIGERDGVKRDDGQLTTSMEFIKPVLKGLIGRNLYDQDIYWEIVNTTDPVFSEAVYILTHPTLYDDILAGRVNIK